MKLFEAGRFDEAATALTALASDSGSGVIARFRSAEALSRLGRHDEAIAAARQAAADDSTVPAPSVWLAHVLAEAGEYEAAAAVPLPATSVEPLDFLSAAYSALAKVVADDRSDARTTMKTILDARHSPIYSLVLRVLEARRLASEVRWPDIPSVWYAIVCDYELNDLERKIPADKRKLTHPEPPKVAPHAAPATSMIARWIQTFGREFSDLLSGGGDVSAAADYVREHVGCADQVQLVAYLRGARKLPDDLDEIEIECHLANGRLDEALEATEKLAAQVEDKASGELCILRTRIAQVRGDAKRVTDFAGHDDAMKRMDTTVIWLDMAATLMDGDALAARPLADQLADPANPEFVETALKRWAGAVRSKPAAE